MSTVLIGIVAVVLTVGLALAGALILGSDFMTATSSARAVSMLKQTQDGLEMYVLKTGAGIDGYADLEGIPNLTPRFLRTIYADPDSGEEPVLQQFGSSLYIVLGGVGDDVCRAANDALAGTPNYPTYGRGGGDLPTQGGCFTYGTSGYRRIYLRMKAA